MKIGFIGTGNMGTAIIKGCIAKDHSFASRIFASDIDFDKTKAMAEALGINACKTNEEVVKNSDIIILSVKPNIYDRVLSEIKTFVSGKHIIVSIAPGISIGNIEKFFTDPVKVIRTMPNTPAMVNEGMTAVCKNQNITDEDLKSVLSIFNNIGKTEVIDEKLMDVVTSVSGSSPAYVYMFIEALADGAVLHGMPRQQAYRFASQAVMGSAKMVLESGMHPGFLKDMVCSPGGTTIEAVKSLEQNKFRSAVIEAVDVCTEKSKKMGK